MSIYLSVVIPAYNEENRIIPTIKSVDSYLTRQKYPYEIIVVNDGSTDRTVEVVQKFQKTVKNLKLNINPINHGKGFAVRDGVGMAEGNHILFMDADNATHIEEVGEFWPYFKKGFDVVIGSRHIKGSKIVVEQPWYRKLLGRAANLLIQIVILHGIKDTQCGFKAFTRKAAREIFAVQEIAGWGFDMEILVIARKWGYKIKEMPVSWYNIGESRLRPIKAALRTLKDLFRIKWNSITGKYDKKPILLR